MNDLTDQKHPVHFVSLTMQVTIYSWKKTVKNNYIFKLSYKKNEYLIFFKKFDLK